MRIFVSQFPALLVTDVWSVNTMHDWSKARLGARAFYATADVKEKKSVRVVPSETLRKKSQHKAGKGTRASAGADAHNAVSIGRMFSSSFSPTGELRETPMIVWGFY